VRDDARHPTCRNDDAIAAHRIARVEPSARARRYNVKAQRDREPQNLTRFFSRRGRDCESATSAAFILNVPLADDCHERL
jgi:hypothetical protein